MSASCPQRLSLALCAGVTATLCLTATPAHATDLPAPRRSSADTLGSDPTTALDRWLSAAPSAVTDPRAASLVVAEDDALRLELGSPYGAGIAPLPIEASLPAADAAGFDIVIGSTGGAALAERLASAATSGGAELAGGTRFDVRPADRNAISLPGTVVDRLVLRVVRTPEPSTLALFAAGAVGLALVVRRRRRRALRPTASA